MLIYDHEKIGHIEVYKFEFKESRWSIINNLGDRVLFVSTYGYGTSYSTSKFSLQENCI